MSIRKEISNGILFIIFINEMTECIDGVHINYVNINIFIVLNRRDGVKIIIAHLICKTFKS